MKLLRVFLSVFAATCPHLSADTYVVTTTSDAGAGSLRQAIANANATPEDSSITISATGTVLLSSPLPTLGRNTSIIGPGAALLRISGGNAHPIFSMAAGTTNKLFGITVTDGFADTNFNGAAISNAGVLTVEHCVIANNHSVGGLGGAIFTAGDMTVMNTVVVSNSILSSPVNGNAVHFALGGGIFATNCQLYLTSSSFTGNQAEGSSAVAFWTTSGGGASGGALYLIGGAVSGAQLRFAHNLAMGGKATAANNWIAPAGAAQGGAICAISAKVILEESFLDANSSIGGEGASYFGPVTVGGGNGEGGALWMHGCSLRLLSSVFSNNTSICGTPNNAGHASGGAIFVSVSEGTLDGLAVISNSSIGSRGAQYGRVPIMSDALGGGIYARNASLTIRTSTAANNQSTGSEQRGIDNYGGVDGGRSFGGFLFSLSSTVTVVNACISGNAVVGGEGSIGIGRITRGRGGDALGGAIFAEASVLTNIHSTIASNSAVGGATGGTSYGQPGTNGPGSGTGGGIYCTNATVAFLNTILAENSVSTGATDLFGAAVSLGHNLVGDSAGSIGWVPSDLLNVDPLLAPLRLNGGRTPNHALLCGSPAIDGGDDSAGEAADQRGVSRPQGTHVDIGSFEYVNAGSPPTVTVFPQSQKLFAGTNTTLVALPEGYGGFRYQWRKDGQELAGATGRTLSLTNLNRTHRGAYSVVLTDCFGVVTSGVSMLLVQYVNAYAAGSLLNEDRYHFDGPVMFELQSYFPGGLIFYTLDGSTPGIDSQLYTGPFELRQNAILRSVGYSDDFFDSGESEPVLIELAAVYTFQASTPGGGYVEWTPRQERYISGTPVTVSAVASNGWRFLGWLGDIGQASDSASITLNVSRDRCVQAVFGTTLETSAAGNGVLKVQPAGDYFPYGSVVQIHAVPGSNSYFGFWGGSASGTNNPNSLLITSPEPRVSSIFGSLGSNQVSLSVVPKGFGRASVGPYSTRYVRGTVVTVTASPDAEQIFLGWEGDVSGTLNPLTVQLDRSKVVTPVFTRRPKLLSGECLDGWSSEGFWSTVVGQMGSRYRIDVSTNLQQWSMVTTISNSFGSVSFSDPVATNSPRRFYRAVEQP